MKNLMIEYQLPESKKRIRILLYAENIIRQLPILPYTQAAAEWHGKEAAHLQSIGKSPPFIDSQIAAIAKTNNLILVTRNLSDFKNFPDLRMESWFF
jgi:tRNA(fMet)-specific endonuclease VapC